LALFRFGAVFFRPIAPVFGAELVAVVEVFAVVFFLLEAGFLGVLMLSSMQPWVSNEQEKKSDGNVLAYSGSGARDEVSGFDRGLFGNDAIVKIRARAPSYGYRWIEDFSLIEPILARGGARDFHGYPVPLLVIEVDASFENHATDFERPVPRDH
jgi:hypothetical protein